MTSLEKLRAIAKDKVSSRFVRVESIKDGQVIASDVYDRSLWTETSIEKDICRRTLALVRAPFTLRILNISPDGSAKGLQPHLLEH